MFSFEPAEHSHKHDNGDGTEDQLCDELRIREAVQREQPIQHKQRGNLQHDLAHNSALETTLRCLLQNDMDYKAVADQLFLHKNTVLQRKQKITSLYPEDPFVLPAKKQFEFAFILEALYPL